MYKTFFSFDGASIPAKVKETYLIWVNIVPHIPKCARYTIATRIENKFLDFIELSYTSYFSDKTEKLTKVTKCILLLDTLKFFIYISWEARFIDNKQYGKLVVRLDDIGKMLGGWKKSLALLKKKNPV